jgi:hypothetical protein
VAEEPQLELGPFPYDLKGELQHRDPRLVGRVVVVRDRRYTYVERLYEGPELYDRVADPDERVNIAGRPEHAQVQRALREAILRWLMETGHVIPHDKDPRLADVHLPRPGASARAPEGD